MPRLGSPEIVYEISDADIKYWQPQTLGDALFNWWD